MQDGNLIENAALKQADAISALPHLSELVTQNNGTMMLFNNTPDFFADPAARVIP